VARPTVAFGPARPILGSPRLDPPAGANLHAARLHLARWLAPRLEASPPTPTRLDSGGGPANRERVNHDPAGQSSAVTSRARRRGVRLDGGEEARRVEADGWAHVSVAVGGLRAPLSPDFFIGRRPGEEAGGWVAAASHGQRGDADRDERDHGAMPPPPLSSQQPPIRYSGVV
jgi:hypothetical protein